MRKLKVYATKLLRIMTDFDEKRYPRAENLVSGNLGYSLHNNISGKNLSNYSQTHVSRIILGIARGGVPFCLTPIPGLLA